MARRTPALVIGVVLFYICSSNANCFSAFGWNEPSSRLLLRKGQSLSATSARVCSTSSPARTSMTTQDENTFRRSFLIKMVSTFALSLVSVAAPATAKRLDEYEQEEDIARYVGSLEKFSAKQLITDTMRFISMRPDAKMVNADLIIKDDVDAQTFASLIGQLMAEASITAPAKSLSQPSSGRSLPGAPWFVQDIVDRVTEMIRRYPALAATARIGSQGKTSMLHWAAREGLLEACRLLVEAGASPTAVCDSEYGSKSAIELAMADIGSGGINSGSTQRDVVLFLQARSRPRPAAKRKPSRSTQLWFDR